MRKIFLPSFLFVILFTIGACFEETQNNNSSDSAMILYDSVLAEKLGADDYGMKSYVIAFLKAGPNRDQDSSTAVELQKAHRANIGRLADEGLLALAGPFLDDSEFARLFIFNVSTVEEAKALTESDPAIQAGRLVMELHPWYGTAGLMQVNEIHKKIKK